VAATNFGRTSHLGWVHNLEAEPKATLEVDGEVTEVVTRKVDAQEVLEIWPLFDGICPGYGEYREIAPRNIKAFVLTPSAVES
jgi:deazaflavin-dependent oxidoreductase (nitroreductase family)